MQEKKIQKYLSWMEDLIETLNVAWALFIDLNTLFNSFKRLIIYCNNKSRLTSRYKKKMFGMCMIYLVEILCYFYNIDVACCFHQMVRMYILMIWFSHFFHVSNDKQYMCQFITCLLYCPNSGDKRRKKRYIYLNT